MNAPQFGITQRMVNPIARRNIALLSVEEPRRRAMKQGRYVAINETFMDRCVHWSPQGDKVVFHPKTNESHLLAVYKAMRAGEFDLEKARAKTVYVAPGHKTNVGNPNPKGPSGGGGKNQSKGNKKGKK